MQKVEISVKSFGSCQTEVEHLNVDGCKTSKTIFFNDRNKFTEENSTNSVQKKKTKEQQKKNVYQLYRE